mgnify:CR=1 FL=1
MEQFVIKGGNPIVGEVEIGGAKNAALAILAASIMTDETVTIDNLPDVRDINIMLDALSDIGAVVERVDRHTARINGSTIGQLNVDYEYIKKIRASYYLLGALLGKYKRAEVALPGGCVIGSRPIDLHVKGFKALGADVDISYGLISAKADHLVGSHIYMDKVSVGATINVLMAAALAEGKTVIENAAKEPHVVDVANFLNSMGANIRGAGTDVIRIVGVEKLHKTSYSVIPDQIEAGTFMCAAAATKGDVLIKNVDYNPVAGQIDSIEFQALVSNEKVHSVAEIVLVNHEKIAEGVLQEDLNEVAYMAYPASLVDQVMVDVGEMKIGDVIRVKDLSLAADPDITIKTNPESIVVSLMASHNVEAPAEDTEAAEEK